MRHNTVHNTVHLPGPRQGRVAPLGLKSGPGVLQAFYRRFPKIQSQSESESDCVQSQSDWSVGTICRFLDVARSRSDARPDF
eukprot:270759-Prorocentrum_minimum.AAC.1